MPLNFPRQRAPVSTETVRTDDLYPLTGSEIDVHGDLNIGANALKTTSLIFKERDSSKFAIYASDGVTARSLYLNVLYFKAIEGISGADRYFRTPHYADQALIFDSHDGSAYRTTLKLVGGQAEWHSWDGSADQLVAKGNAGYLELARAKLTGDLDFNSYKIVGLYRDVGDYGGNFTNYTPPTGAEGMMILAVDTNATNPGQRIYVYVNGDWHYVDLT